jgi:hypothetical protein
MGAYFTIMAATMGLGYFCMGANYYDKLVQNLKKAGKYGDYTLYDLNENDNEQSRKIIPGKKPFVLFNFSQYRKNHFIFGPTFYPVYFGVGHAGPVTLPINDNSCTTTEHKGICDEWNRPGVYGKLQPFKDQQFNPSMDLYNQKNIDDFCSDIGASSRQFNFTVPVRANFITTNSLHILAGRGLCYAGIDRNKLIMTTAELLSKQKYPGFSGAGLVSTICILLWISKK